jgi:IQ domain-containing protein G
LIVSSETLQHFCSSSITPDILQHRDELSKFIGDEIARILREQKNYEKKYEELIELRASMKGMVNKIKYKEVETQIQDVSRALRETTNHLVRSLKENPNISGNLIKVKRDRSELNDVLLHCMHEIRDRGHFFTITHKVDEEKQSKIGFEKLKLSEKHLREEVTQLQRTLDEEQKAFNHTTMEQKQSILQLKQELMTKKSDHGMGAKFRLKESQASVSAILRDYKHQQHILELKVHELENKLHLEQVVNHETKEFLQRKTSSLQETVNQWENKYDKDLGDLDSKIAGLSLERNALSEKLSALQHRWEEDSAKDEERRRLKALEIERIKAEKALLKKQNRSARAIQRAMRSYIKRKKDLELAKGPPKPKKDKKGKDGKKKK